jgi:hypothetical protein
LRFFSFPFSFTTSLVNTGELRGLLVFAPDATATEPRSVFGWLFASR